MRTIPIWKPALLALTIAGCEPTTASGDISSASTVAAINGAQASAEVAVEDGPCHLLTDAEVRAVFPLAGAGRRDQSRQAYGVDACHWDEPARQFSLQTWKAEPGSVENEIRGASLGFVDPVNPAARNNVRYETVAGVGDGAMAVVETRDEPRGILTDVAMLVTQRGDRVIVLSESGLARRERGEAIAVLQRLGRSAAERD